MTGRLVGFDDTLNLLELDANLVLDFRDFGGRTSSGFYLEAFGGGVLPLDRYAFVHYGAELSVFVDLYKKTRVLMLRAALEGVAGEDGDIPFTELPRLGGAKRLRGYVTDRFRDKLAVLGTAQYRFPVHQSVSAELFVEVGKVGRSYEDVFGSADRWRFAFGGNIVIHSKDSVIMRLGIGYGDGVAVFFSTGPLQAFDDRSKQI